MTSESEKDEAYVLDLEAADKLLLSYKRGVISRSEVSVRLLCEAGIPPHLVERAIDETDDTDIRELEKWEK